MKRKTSRLALPRGAIKPRYSSLVHKSEENSDGNICGDNSSHSGPPEHLSHPSHLSSGSQIAPTTAVPEEVARSASTRCADEEKKAIVLVPVQSSAPQHAASSDIGAALTAPNIASSARDVLDISIEDEPQFFGTHGSDTLPGQKSECATSTVSPEVNITSTAGEEGGSTAFSCLVCGVDIDHLSEIDRTRHVNSCLDYQDVISAPPSYSCSSNKNIESNESANKKEVVVDAMTTASDSFITTMPKASVVQPVTSAPSAATNCTAGDETAPSSTASSTTEAAVTNATSITGTKKSCKAIGNVPQSIWKKSSTDSANSSNNSCSSNNPVTKADKKRLTQLETVDATLMQRRLEIGEIDSQIATAQYRKIQVTKDIKKLIRKQNALSAAVEEGGKGRRPMCGNVEPCERILSLLFPTFPFSVTAARRHDRSSSSPELHRTSPLWALSQLNPSFEHMVASLGINAETGAVRGVGSSDGRQTETNNDKTHMGSPHPRSPIVLARQTSGGEGEEEVVDAVKEKEEEQPSPSLLSQFVHLIQAHDHSSTTPSQVDRDVGGDIAGAIANGPHADISSLPPTACVTMRTGVLPSTSSPQSQIHSSLHAIRDHLLLLKQVLSADSSCSRSHSYEKLSETKGACTSHAIDRGNKIGYLPDTIQDVTALCAQVLNHWQRSTEVGRAGDTDVNAGISEVGGNNSPSVSPYKQENNKEKRKGVDCPVTNLKHSESFHRGMNSPSSCSSTGMTLQLDLEGIIGGDSPPFRRLSGGDMGGANDMEEEDHCPQIDTESGNLDTGKNNNMSNVSNVLPCSLDDRATALGAALQEGEREEGKEDNGVLEPLGEGEQDSEQCLSSPSSYLNESDAYMVGVVHYMGADVTGAGSGVGDTVASPNAVISSFCSDRTEYVLSGDGEFDYDASSCGDDNKYDNDDNGDIGADKEPGQKQEQDPDKRKGNDKGTSNRSNTTSSSSSPTALPLDILACTTEPDLSRYSLEQLQQVCAQYGLRTAGSRPQLMLTLSSLWTRLHCPSSSTATTHVENDEMNSKSIRIKREGCSVGDFDSEKEENKEEEGEGDSMESLLLSSQDRNLTVCRNTILTFIRNHPKLYEDVLCFVPLDIQMVQREMKRCHVIVSKSELQQVLDAEGIFSSCIGNKRKVNDSSE